MREITIEAVIANANRPGFKLTDQECEFILHTWDEFIFETLPTIASPNQLDIAGGTFCDDVDLPAGSYWIQVIAAFMDKRDEFLGPQLRLPMLNAALAEYGLIDTDPVEITR